MKDGKKGLEEAVRGGWVKMKGGVGEGGGGGEGLRLFLDTYPWWRR